jgi:hypothetical protein
MLTQNIADLEVLNEVIIPAANSQLSVNSPWTGFG